MPLSLPTRQARHLSLNLLSTLLFCSFLWILIPLLLAGTAHAQQVYGALTGNVTDATGAAVPQTKVTIQEINRGVVFRTHTNNSGFYNQGQLVPGTYVITVDAPSFKRAVSEPLMVQLDNVTRFDVRLTPGAESEVVVQANQIPLLQTDRADISTTFTSQDVLNLPDYQRNVLSLEFLVPGVTLPTGDSTPPSENPQGSYRARINGRVFGATGYQLDGTDDQDAWLGSAVINPNPDSLAEEKVSTENFDAENGYVSGGLLAFSTKSGSNTLHGSLFEYLINNSPGFQTQGSDPFTQPNGPPPLKSNQFGGSIGGPILHDKLFFFGDAQLQRLRANDNVLTTVPTQQVRDTCLNLSVAGFCDLSQYISNNGQAYDPMTGDYLYRRLPTNNDSMVAGLRDLLQTPDISLGEARRVAEDINSEQEAVELRHAREDLVRQQIAHF